MINERGNVLFLVLIVAALFAALSYAVTQSSDGSGSSIDYERNEILASDILKYAKTLERGVSTILNNGHSENDISFAHDDLAGYGTYGDSPETEVFNPLGGGVTLRTFPQATSNEWIFTGGNVVEQVGGFSPWVACDATCAELIAMLENIPEDLCIQINDLTGVDNPTDTPPVDYANYNNDKFTGTYTKGNLIGNHLDTSNPINHQRSACFESTATGNYIFYHVLYAR
jgi:hypothetical protein